MQNKKLIILIILSILAVISLIYGIVTPPHGRRMASTRKEGIMDAERASAAKDMDSAKRRAKRTQFTTWRRRPFIPEGFGMATSSRFALSGIIGTGKNAKAMIGDAIVGKGDKVGANTVVEVKQDRVILNDGVKDFELRLEQ